MARKEDFVVSNSDGLLCSQRKRPNKCPAKVKPFQVEITKTVSVCLVCWCCHCLGSAGSAGPARVKLEGELSCPVPGHEGHPGASRGVLSRRHHQLQNTGLNKWVLFLPDTHMGGAERTGHRNGSEQEVRARCHREPEDPGAPQQRQAAAARAAGPLQGGAHPGAFPLACLRCRRPSARVFPEGRGGLPRAAAWSWLLRAELPPRCAQGLSDFSRCFSLLGQQYPLSIYAPPLLLPCGSQLD